MIQTLPTIVGEWSLAITDCQKYLHNGYDEPYVAPDAGKDARICLRYNSNFDTYSEYVNSFATEGSREFKSVFFFKGLQTVSQKLYATTNGIL